MFSACHGAESSLWDAWCKLGPPGRFGIEVIQVSVNGTPKGTRIRQPQSGSSEGIPPLVSALAEDAKKNASGLPKFANRSQRMANRITALSSILAAATSLTIWVTLQQSPAWWAKVIVASATLVAAVLALLPRIYQWNEHATEARKLSSEYGHLYGDILKLEGEANGKGFDQAKIDELRSKLEALKERRQNIDALVPN